MLVASPRSHDLLARLAAQVAAMHLRRLRVAVDGVDGAGKSVFAEELADRVRVTGRPAVRASVDGFHRPSAERYRLGRSSPDGFYRESYDYQQLAELLLEPFAPGGSGRYRASAFDHRTDAPVSAPEQQAAPDAVLILDGIFLYVEGQRRYLREAQPWERATVIVDNTDLAEPVIIEPTLVSADSNL
jgi:uridine kinase